MHDEAIKFHLIWMKIVIIDKLCLVLGVVSNFMISNLFNNCSVDQHINPPNFPECIHISSIFKHIQFERLLDIHKHKFLGEKGSESTRKCIRIQGTEE